MFGSNKMRVYHFPSAEYQPKMFLIKTRFTIKVIFFFVILVTFAISFSNVYAGRFKKNEAKNVRSFFVKEPVFNSKVYVSESGMQHDHSVVLVHGVSEQASADWQGVVDVVNDSFHVIALDLPGFGRSEKKDIVYSIEKYSRFLNWFIETYTKKPVSLVGHSLGGAISLFYAGTYPNGIQRLIIADVPGILHRSAYFSSFIRLSPTGQNSDSAVPLYGLEQVFKALLNSFDEAFAPDDFTKWLNADIIRNRTKENDARIVAGLSLMDTDFSEKINNISVPTNIMWGENDAIAPVRTARLLFGSIPNSTLYMIPNGSHSPMITEPAEFNTQLLIYLHGNAGHKNKSFSGSRNSDEQFEISDKEDILLEGHYKKLLINNCGKIRLLNATVEQITIENSEVTIENSTIQSSTYAISAIDSIVTITGSTIKGENAMIVNNCDFDVAGGKIEGTNSAILSRHSTRILFSVCKVKSLLTDRYYHGVIYIYKNKPI